MKQPEFLKKPLEKMTAKEWESICDGCGLCCQIRVQDEDTGELALSNAACKFLCLETNQCSDYKNRQKNVPDCVKVTPKNIHELTWLPHTCGYRLVAAGQKLFSWHHLICGDKNRVHTKGPSMLGELVSEDDAEF